MQVVPYFVITCGEIMFSVTGLEFSYQQASVHKQQTKLLMFSILGSKINESRFASLLATDCGFW